jgi:hypothetical protein
VKEEFVNGWWQIRLDDGSVVARQGEHCLEPHVVNGFLFYVMIGPNSHAYVARDLTTHQDQSISQLGGHHEFSTDGRYAMMVSRFQPQGDKAGYLSNLVTPIFDTVEKRFLDFSATSRVFFFTGGPGPQPKILWIKKGNPGAPGPDDPGGHVTVNFKFESPGVLAWSTVEKTTSGVQHLALSYSRWRRSINFSNGALGPIEPVASVPVMAWSPAPLNKWVFLRTNAKGEDLTEVPSWL